MTNTLRYLLAGCAAVAFAGPTAAADQIMLEVRFLTLNNDFFDDTSTSFAGQFAYDFGQMGVPLGVQLDVGTHSHDSISGENYPHYVLHVNTMVADTARVGAYIGQQDFDFFGETTDILGLEAAFGSGAFSGEVYAGQVNWSGGWELTAIGGEARYELGLSGFPVELMAGYHNLDDDVDTFSRLILGGGVEVVDGVHVDLFAARADYAGTEANEVGFAVTYALGGGAPMGERDWIATIGAF